MTECCCSSSEYEARMNDETLWKICRVDWDGGGWAGGGQEPHRVLVWSQVVAPRALRMTVRRGGVPRVQLATRRARAISRRSVRSFQAFQQPQAARTGPAGPSRE